MPGSMRVHHLDCGRMRAGGLSISCHVLLVETGAGLVLVDTGFGAADVADPRRLGAARWLLRPDLDPAGTAIAQVRALGHDPADVRHIVLTHGDVDHVGGLADFPGADVHLSADEWSAVTSPTTLRERLRYRPTPWAHEPRVITHEVDGEPWHGLTARPLPGVDDAIALLPLPGHTRGHLGVAVRLGPRTIVHAGDAFFHRGALDGRRQPAALRFTERVDAHDWARVLDNHTRLARLQREAPDVLVVNAHDPLLLARARATARQSR